MFPVQDLENTIILIKDGENLAREDFLEQCKPFVFKTACRISRRALEWGRDDELAVALIAFNEAIDRYRVESGVPFLAYARMVMGSRLTDHYRKESRIAQSSVLLPPNGYVSGSLEYAKSWEVYWEEKAAEEREEEIKEFGKLLTSYGVTFEDLVKCSPRHRDTRQTLMRAAWSLAEEGPLFEELRQKKKLPLMELEKSTGIRRKNLERGRKYIIAMALLISMREEFLYLSSYLRMPSGFKGDTNECSRDGC
ncbi:RNA polymerase sigma factor SigI [Pelotomaculum sp. FP]|uniref:RNA polymerase sigma-I factor n=1 Tax=Pelotomaculum sp. FP TaxID=261474 RepID=UPI0010657D16|nr:RNA polymerase sigma-I factor [Pelotomaculum sp. FP]TEB17296.1 RNA polymerase sigma factor SigI [Pelotomaculum sp. FP]